MKRPAILLAFFLIFLTCSIPPSLAFAETCEKVVGTVNAKLAAPIDENELVDILHNLNTTGNKKLPDKFVTKAQAKSRGWKPGRDLWSVSALKGASIGGDKFGNFEGQLPKNKWREADLDYQGGHRGVKRLIFSYDGKRYITVDHYKTFTEVPACR